MDFKYVPHPMVFVPLLHIPSPPRTVVRKSVSNFPGIKPATGQYPARPFVKL